MLPIAQGADGTQVAPEWVILTKAPSVWLVERPLFLKQFDTLFSYPHPQLWGSRSHPPLLFADLLPSQRDIQGGFCKPPVTICAWGGDRT